MIFLDMLQNVTQCNLLSMETLSQDNFYHWKTSGKSSELGELSGKGESGKSEGVFTQKSHTSWFPHSHQFSLHF